MDTTFDELPYKNIEHIFGHDKFYVKLFKKLLNAVTYDTFNNLSNIPNELINEYKKIREKVEKFIKSQIYEPIYESTAYSGLITSLIDIYSVYYTITFLRKNISTFSIQPDEVIDNYLDSFGFPGKNLFNYIQKRKICEIVYWYLSHKGTPQVIIKLLNLLGFSYFFIADYQILEYENEVDEELYVDDPKLILNDILNIHVFKNNLIHEEKIYENDTSIFYHQLYEYNDVYINDSLCLINEEELNNDPNIIYPAQSSYYQLGIVSTYTELERIISAFTYAVLKKIKDDYYENNLYTCNVNGYNDTTSFMGLVLGYQYILGEYFGIYDADLYEPYKIKEIFDDKIKFDLQKHQHTYENELNINNHIITEYDGGSSKTFDEEYINFNYNGGNCGLIFYEYDGGFSYIDDIYYTLDLNGGNCGDIIIIYDGGSALTSEINYIKRYYNEYDNGDAYTLIFNLFEYDNGRAWTYNFIFNFNCGYSFNNYYVNEFNNGPSAYINNNIYDGGYSNSIKYKRYQLNNAFAANISSYAYNGGNANNNSYEFLYNEITGSNNIFNLQKYITNGYSNSTINDSTIKFITFDNDYDNGKASTNFLPSIVYFDYLYEYDLKDSRIPNNIVENEYNIEINGGDSIIRANEIYFFNKEFNNGFANSFIFEEKDIDNFYRRNGYTWEQYDNGEVYRSELKEIYDSMGKFHVKTKAKTEWEKRFDMDIIIDQNGNIWDSKYIIDKNFQYKDLYNYTFYKLKYPVFGWKKDIKDNKLIDIMNDINYEVKRISTKLLWLPDISQIENLYKNNRNIKNNIKTRKEYFLNELNNIFYTLPIFGTYDDAIKYFINHDENFKNYIDSIILSEEERLKIKDNEKLIARNFNNVLELMNSILESMEYFIFDNTGYMIPVRNIILSYKNIINILNQFEQHYIPYHNKLLYPLIYWMIKDFPGDQVAIDDNKMVNSYKLGSFKDVVWRANHYTLNDIAPPEPYNPITDFNGSNNNMPHIPISNNYRVKPEYDREEIQKNNPNMYSIGYDWRNLSNNNLIVRRKYLQPIYDWDPDYMRTTMVSSIIDTIDICRPDQEIVKEELEKELNLKKYKIYIDTHVTVIVGNGLSKSYDITHNLNSYNIFINVYDIDTGFNIENCKLTRLNSNMINITFNDVLTKTIKLLIFAPHTNLDIAFNKLSSERYNISGNGYLNHFMVLHNLKSKNIYHVIYNRKTGEVIDVPTRKINNDFMYVSFDNAPNNDNHYKINLVNIIDNDEPNVKVYPCDTLYREYNFDNVKDDCYYHIEHNFYTNNIVIHAYNRETLINEKIDITFIDVNNLKIKFNSAQKNNNYRIILTAALGIVNHPRAIPLNNIAGFMGSFKGNNEDKEFYIYHNINSINTFEQVIDFKTGEVIKVLIDRINENCIRITFGKPPKITDRYIVYIFAPMNINSLTYPSTYLNTSLLQFKVLSALEINEINNGDSNNNQYMYLTNGWSFKRLNEYDGEDSLAIYPTKNLDNYYSKIPKIKINKNNNTKYITNGYAPDIYLPLNFDKDFDGGKAFTCDCKYCKAINETDYIIKHNIGNKNVIVQVYNKYYQKIECYSQILDKNHILVSFKKPIPRCEYYNINVLSIPDTSIPLQEYNNIKYNKKSFIGSYYEELPIKEKYEEVEKITIDEYDGGYATTPIEKYTKTLDNAFASTSLILFKQNYDGGDASTEKISYFNTFTITHNLNTKILIVNVYDNNTKETVNCWISINDKNNVTIGFKDPPIITDKYTAVIIGALPIADINDHLDKDVDSVDYYKQAHFNKEIIIEMKDKFSKHLNMDTDFYDQENESITINNKKHNLQAYDCPVMKEKLVIIHEIKNKNETINNYATEINGFNEYKIMVNDKIYGKEPYIDVDYTTTTIDTYESFKKIWELINRRISI